MKTVSFRLLIWRMRRQIRRINRATLCSYIPFVAMTRENILTSVSKNTVWTKTSWWWKTESRTTHNSKNAKKTTRKSKIKTLQLWCWRENHWRNRMRTTTIIQWRYSRITTMNKRVLQPTVMHKTKDIQKNFFSFYFLLILIDSCNSIHPRSNPRWDKKKNYIKATTQKYGAIIKRTTLQNYNFNLGVRITTNNEDLSLVCWRLDIREEIGEALFWYTFSHLTTIDEWNLLYNNIIGDNYTRNLFLRELQTEDVQSKNEKEWHENQMKESEMIEDKCYWQQSIN
jgi:hypothetical protein